MKFASQFPYSVFQLFAVNFPIAQARRIVIAHAKPAIIQYQKFNSKVSCGAGPSQQLFVIEIKIHGFPAVDEHGTAFRSIFSTEQMAELEAVKIVGKRVKPAVAITA